MKASFSEHSYPFAQYLALFCKCRDVSPGEAGILLRNEAARLDALCAMVEGEESEPEKQEREWNRVELGESDLTPVTLAPSSGKWRRESH